MNGIVRSYDPERGFGFIHPLIGKPRETEDLFFHISNVLPMKDGNVPQSFPRGAECRFLVVRSKRGPTAINVEVIETKLQTRSKGALLKDGQR